MTIPPETAERLLAACVDESGQAVALFGADDHLQFANDTFLDLFAIDAVGPHVTFTSIMRHCHQSGRGLKIEHPDFDVWLADVNQRRRRIGQRYFEADFCDGRWVWINETMRDDGTVSVIGTDITRLKHNEKNLRRARDKAVLAANTDSLTGLFNRRFAFDRLKEMVARENGNGADTCSVCMLDLDHFKAINDTFGHPVGDRVIQHFATMTHAQIRPSDVLSRIGGEEFLLLLPDTSTDRAVRALDRLRQLLSEAAPCAEFPAVRFTFSAGVTAIRPGDTEETVIHRADAALYAAKQAGRDCHLLADGEPRHAPVDGAPACQRTAD
jgi:diguanylate cyclase (GGDEF)-like protein